MNYTVKEFVDEINAIFVKYPGLEEKTQEFMHEGFNDFLTVFLCEDDKFAELTVNRADIGKEIFNTLIECNRSAVYNKFEDACAERGLYELDLVYKKGMLDAVKIIERLINSGWKREESNG